MATKTAHRSGIGLAAIAQRLGVSQMTVSRALRGVGRVDPDTRDRVWATARELGYRRAGDIVFASPVARGRSDRDLHLALPMLGDKDLIDSSFGLVMYQSISQHLADIGGSLTARRVPTIEAAVDLCRETRARGIILRQTLPHAWLDRLRRLAPIAVVGSYDYVRGVDTIYTSEFRAAAMALDHLAGLGHRGVAWFGIVDHHQPDDFAEHLFSAAVTSDRMANSNQYPRYAAWQNLCLPVSGIGATPTCHLLLLPRDWRTEGIDAVVQRGFAAFCALTPRPTAVVLPTDPMAQAWLRACTLAGAEVPRHHSVLSYGSIIQVGESTPFTTILLPIAEQGRLAVEMLQRRIARPDARAVSIQLEPELVVGTTTGAACAS
jgi:LacI family transcriptional regulator